MSQEAGAPPAPPQPTDEHKALQEHCGDWNVDCTFYMDPSQPPMNIKGKEKVEMFGGFWTTSQFEADMFGSPFKGRCILGYDPIGKKYISTWIDTMSSTFFKFEGNFDSTGKILEMSGKAYECMGGGDPKLANYRTTEEHKGPDERVFEMFTTLPDGTEIKMFTHVYTRA